MATVATGEMVITPRINKVQGNAQAQARIEALGRIAGTFNSAKRPLGELNGLASEFEKSMGAANARVLAFGASVGVIVGLQRAFVGLVTEAVTFQNEMVKINSVMNLSNASLSNFGDGLFDVAKRTAQSVRDVSTAALEFSRQGKGAQETLKSTESAMILARLAGVDAAESVKRLTAAVNSFKNEGLAMSEILDRIVKVEQNYAVDSDDLTSAIQRSGSVAAEAGVKFNELIGIVTAVQERTARGGAVIGNAFKTIFTRLQNETRLHKVESMLNIKLFDENQNMRPMMMQIQMIADALKNVKDQTKSAGVMTEIAGPHQIGQLTALMQDLQSGSSVTKAALEEAANAAGDAASKNNYLNTSIVSQFKTMTEGARQMAVEFGKLGTMTWAQTLVSIGQSAVDIINGLLKRTDDLGIGFRGIGKALSSFLGPALAIGAVVVAKFFTQFVKFAKDSVQSLLHVGNSSNTILTLENQIVQALATDKDFRSFILNTTISQEQKEKDINAMLVGRIALTKEMNTVAKTAATNLAAGFALGKSGLTATPSNAKTVQEMALGNAFAAEEYQKTKGGALTSDTTKSVQVRTAGRGTRTAVINSSEVVTDLPGFGTVITPRSFKSSIAKDNFNTSMVMSKEAMASGTKQQTASARSLGIKKLVDSYINIALLGLKGADTSRFDYPASMLSTIRSDKKRSHIFFDLFGHWKDMYAGERKTSLGSKEGRTGASLLSKLTSDDPAAAAVMLGGVEQAAISFIKSGGAATGYPIKLGTGALNRNYTAIFPTNDESKAYSSAHPLTAFSATLGAFGKTKGTQASSIELKNVFARSFNLYGSSEMKKNRMGPSLFDKFTKSRSIMFPMYSDLALTPERVVEKLKAEGEVLKNVPIEYTYRKSFDKGLPAAYRTEKRQAHLPGVYDNYATGRVPNFADPIRAAVAREMASGVPSSSIYLDSHSALKNSSNPMGLMVANKIDEPNGGYQGVARAYSEGRDPKTYNIPNFAKKTFDANTLNADGSRMPQVETDMLNDELAVLVGKVKSSSVSLADAIKEVVSWGKAFNVGAKAVAAATNEIKNAFTGRAGAATLPSLATTPQQAPQTPWNPQSFAQAALAGAAQTPPPSKIDPNEAFKKIAEETAKNARSKELDSKLNLNDYAEQLSGFSEAFKEKAAKRLGAMRARRAEGATDTPSVINADTRVGDFNPDGTPSSSQSSFAQNARVERRRSRINRLGNGAAFLLPLVGGIADEAINKGKERETMSTGRRFGSALLTDVPSFAATGAMIGGPWGAAAGAVLGLAVAATKASKSVAELAASIASKENIYKERAATGISARDYINKMSSGKAFSDSEMESLKSQREELSKNSDVAKIINRTDFSDSQGVERALKDVADYVKTNKNNETGVKLYGRDFFDKFYKESDMTLKGQDAGSFAASLSPEVLRAFNKLDQQRVAFEDARLSLDGKSMNTAKGTGFSSLSIESLFSDLPKDSKDKSIQEFTAIIKNLQKGGVGDFISNADVGNSDILRKAIRDRAGAVKNKQEEEVGSDNRDFKDRLFGSISNLHDQINNSSFQNDMRDRFLSLSTEIDNVLLESIDDKSSIIQNEGFNALNKSKTSFMSDKLKQREAVATFLASDTELGLSSGSNIEYRKNFSEPALKAMVSGDDKKLEGLLSNFIVMSTATDSKGQRYVDGDAKASAVMQAMDLQNSIRTSGPAQRIAEAEISVRTILNGAMQDSTDSLKAFNQNLDAVNQLAAFKRISEKGAMDFDFAKRDNALKNTVAYPWQLEKMKAANEDYKSRAQEQFDLKAAMDSGKSDLQKILAQTQNTKAIQILTKTLNDYLSEVSSQIAADGSLSVKGLVEKAKTDPTSAMIAAKALKGSGIIDEKQYTSVEDFVKFEKKRSESMKELENLSSLISSFNTSSENAEALVAASRSLLENDKKVNKENILPQLSDELRTLVEALSAENLSATLAAAAGIASTQKGISVNASGFRAANALPDPERELLTSIAKEQSERKVSLRNQELRTKADPLSTQSDKIRSEIARLKADQERAYGTFEDGMRQSMADMETQSKSFAEMLGSTIPNSFRDNMTQAIIDITNQSSSIGDALLKAAAGFLGELNQAFAKQASTQLTNSIMGIFGSSSTSSPDANAAPTHFARGGRVRGGSGVRDDVPAMLMGGEFVMKRSSVQKYGPDFMHAINAGRIRGYASGGEVASSGGGSTAGAIVTGALSSYLNSKVSSDGKMSKEEIDNYKTLRAYGTQKGPNFFIPGVYTPDGKYQGAISGLKNLSGFARQEYTSGGLDRSYDNANGFGWSLEDESARLGIQGRLGSDISKEVFDTKQQALDLSQQSIKAYLAQKEEDKAKKKAQMTQLYVSAIGAVAGAAGKSMSTGYSNAYNSTQGGWFDKAYAGIGGAFTGAQSNGQSYGGLFNAFNSRGYETMNSDGSINLSSSRFSKNSSYYDSLGTAQSPVKSSSGVGGRLSRSSNSASPTTNWKDNAAFPDIGEPGLSGDLLPSRGEIPSVMNLPTPDINSSTFGVDTSDLEALEYSRKLTRDRSNDVSRMSGGDIPTMLNSGEHVVGANTGYSKGFLSRVNSGMMSGGDLGGSDNPVATGSVNKELIAAIEKIKDVKPEINITINMDAAGNSTESSSSSNSKQKEKDLADKIKREVYKIIQDERRQGGMLR